MRKVGRRKGYKHSLETIKKLRAAKLGPRNYIYGKHLSDEHRRKIGRKGEKNGNWKGGRSSINNIIRGSLEYRLWRESVFKRDNYTCIWCKKRGGDLNADHIKSFVDYPELRFAIDNGRTLCIPCHKTTHNYCGKKLKTL